MERSLMEQTGATDEQIRNAIDQGAITKRYFAQPQHVVSSLIASVPLKLRAICNTSSTGIWPCRCSLPGSRQNSKHTQSRN